MSSQYKQEAANWAKAWAAYQHQITDYTGYSMVEVWKGDRKINAWFDKDGQETAKIEVLRKTTEATQENVGELKEWLDNG